MDPWHYIDPQTGEIKELHRTFWKTPYNHDTEAESNRTGLACKDPTRTQQHGKEEADINTIVSRFMKTGDLPQVKMPPTYADYSDVFDLQTALNLVNDANTSFLALPAGVRARFDNDPTKYVKYVDYCLENGDIDPLREMGLAVPKRPGIDDQPNNEPKPPTPPPAPQGAQSDTKA